ncbi:MAG: DUF2178 domain-containing protein [Candidatus Heimdallarchaeota archaeon]
MNRKQWFVCVFGVLSCAGIIIGWSFSLAKSTYSLILPLIGIFALLIGLGILYFLSRYVEEVIEDERTEKISEKAAKMAYIVFSIVFGAAAILLIGFSYCGYPYYQLGRSFLLPVSSLLALYWFFYAYYSLKY